MWQAVIECNPSNDPKLNKYNGSNTTDSIDIVSAGERDPERDGVPKTASPKCVILRQEAI